jgi:hypothetical protein
VGLELSGCGAGEVFSGEDFQSKSIQSRIR